jgi:hydrophobic/amphiphilic exporter-1 (mainly G- bacteria), HAE1 family
MSVSDWFISRPIATSLLMVGIIGVGAVVYPRLPVSSLPDVEFPTISVSASLPGASPETMASAVATPLETQFAAVPGVTQMTSTSSFGSTNVTLQFDLSVDINAAASDVETAINAASGLLPKQLPSPPTFRKVNPTEAPILIISLQSDKYPLTTVDNYAETVLAQHISQINGVGQVIVTGQQKPAVRIQIDPAKLAAMNLGLEDVRTVLETATVDQPKGTFEGPHQAFTIYSNDQLLSAEPWNDIVVAYENGHSSPIGYTATDVPTSVSTSTQVQNGSPVRIRDIGRAIDGPENALVASWQNNKRGILLIIFKQPNSNVISVVHDIQNALPQLRASIPAGIDINIIMDRTQTIGASINDIQLTLLLTIVLVVAVIFLFLRTLWTTVIAGIAIPISILGTFALMYLAGYSLDNLSLMGLAIAVGFVVDDAIVMLENVYRHIELGEEPEAAARYGAAEIGFTIVSMSLSLIAVFIPILLMGGIVGRLFREFAVVITLAILMSAFTSLTLSPMMCAMFLKRKQDESHGRFYYWTEGYYQWAVRHYDRGLTWVLENQFVTLLVLLVTVAITIFLYIQIPKGFFPEQDTGFLQGTTQAAEDISFPAMVELQRKVAAVVARDPDIQAFADSVGGSSMNTGRFYISLKPLSERSSTAQQIIARLRRATAHIPGISLFLLAQQDVNVGGRLSATQYQYTLQDQNLDELDTWAPRILAKFQSMPQLADVASDQQTNARALTLTIDRTNAARFGIQPQLIDDTLYDAVGQRQVNAFYTQAGQYRVIMEIDPALQGDPATLDKIFIKSPVTGGPVPLSTFAHYDTSKPADLSINHQGQFPSVTLSFNLPPGVSLGDAVTAIDNAVAGMGLPAGLSGSFQGTAQAFQQSLSSEPMLVGAAIAVIYIILGMLYESYIHPLTILSTLPSAGLGALLLLLVLQYDLTIIALIGIILLIGIVKKNGIMMVDFALEAERHQGMTPRQSIHQAALVRFRPIMMTTFAALLGAVPLAIGFGVGSELRRPLGIAIVGGLILSQTLTLFTTPVVYLYMDRANNRLNRWRARLSERLHRRPSQSAP